MRLLEHHNDVAESLLIRDYALRLPVAGLEYPTEQLGELDANVVQLQSILAESSGVDQSLSTEAEEFVIRFRRWSKRVQELLENLFILGGEESLPYSQYLKLERLLQLQNGAKAD